MLSVKIEPIDRNLIVALTQGTSPEAQSTALVDFANTQLADAEKTNSNALGTVPTHETFVDQRLVGSLSTVGPTSTIVFDFDLTTPAVAWIYEQLQRHSPVKSGRYVRSHDLFIDGNDENFIVGKIPLGAKELIFAPLVPYARSIEHGLSRQAPDGVYQVVAALARQKFGGMNISFNYFSPPTYSPPSRRTRDARQPAIIIEL